MDEAADVPTDLQEWLLPLLREAARGLQRSFPEVSINAYARTQDGPSPLQSSSVFIDCVLPDVSAERPDEVALGISLKRVRTDWNDSATMDFRLN